jgi:hypothetical protein
VCEEFEEWTTFWHPSLSHPSLQYVVAYVGRVVCRAFAEPYLYGDGLGCKASDLQIGGIRGIPPRGRRPRVIALQLRLQSEIRMATDQDAELQSSGARSGGQRARVVQIAEGYIAGTP